MADLRLFAATSNLIRFTLKNSSTGQGLTGLTNASSGLIISTIADVESSATAYTVAGATIDTIATLGTYAAPTAGHCRFAQVDATNHPGLYEFQFADARFAVTNAKRLVISVSGAASLLNADYEIELVQFNPFDAVRLGLTAFPNVASGNAGALLVDGTGTAAISNSGGKVLLQATQAGVTIPTVTTVTNQLTAAQIATGVWQDATAGDFTAASSIGKSLYTSGNAPGAASGLALVGSNVGTATSVSGAVGSVTGNVGGNVVGSVGSVTGAVGSVTGNVGGSVVGDVQGKVLGGGASAITGVGVNANVIQSAGTTIHNSDGTLASATATTVTFPTTDSAGNSIPDDNRYQYTVIQIVVGTGLGQVVALTTKNGVRTFNILSGTCPVQLDATSQYVVVGSYRSEVDLINGVSTSNVTTVNANVGTTQPMNFTGTGGSALVKGDAVDIGSTAAASATVGTVTNLTNAATSGDLTSAMKTSVENAVWNATLASHLTSGSTGAALNAAGSAGDPWATVIPGAYGAGTAGNIVGNNLDAKVSTRSTLTQSQVTGGTYALNTDVSGNVKVSSGTGANQISLSSGTVTVGTNNDKTGYALTQAFPANFASLAISVGGAVTAGTVSDKTGYALSSAGLDSVVVESGLNARQALSIIASASAGVLAGAATTSVTIAAAGVPATNRLTATCDSSGNRTAVTLNPPA